MELELKVALVILAAAIGEGIIEFIPVPILNLFISPGTNKRVRTVVLNTLSALLGVGLALNFNLGLFSLLGASGSITCVDSVVTGILIGRGSNYAHGFIKSFIIKE